MWWSLRSPQPPRLSLSVIGLAREAAATYGVPLRLHQPEVKGGAEGDLMELLDVETPPPTCAPATARMVRSVKIAPPPSGCGSGCAPWACPHQQHRGHYQLRDAGVRPAHARLRLPLCEVEIIVREKGRRASPPEEKVQKLNANHLVSRGARRGRRERGGEKRRFPDTVDVKPRAPWVNWDGTCTPQGPLAPGHKYRGQLCQALKKRPEPQLEHPSRRDRACGELVEPLGAGEALGRGVTDILQLMCPTPVFSPAGARQDCNTCIGTWRRSPSGEVMVSILDRSWTWSRMTAWSLGPSLERAHVGGYGRSWLKEVARFPRLGNKYP